jgi:hypothetical protein
MLMEQEASVFSMLGVVDYLHLHLLTLGQFPLIKTNCSRETELSQFTGPIADAAVPRVVIRILRHEGPMVAPRVFLTNTGKWHSQQRAAMPESMASPAAKATTPALLDP